MPPLIRHRQARTIAGVLAIVIALPGPAHGITSGLDIGDIQGLPSKPAFNHYGKYSKDQAARREALERRYRAGLEAGKKKAAEELARALPPVETAQGATRAYWKAHPGGDTGKKLVHRQTVSVQFVDHQGQPVAGLTVTPVLRRREAEEVVLATATTRADGKIEVRGLEELPASLGFALPPPPAGPAGALVLPPEWRFRQPEGGELVLDRFQGRSSIKQSKSRVPGVRLATASLAGLVLPALAIPAGRRPPATRPNGTAKLKAVTLAGKAYDRNQIAASLLDGKPLAEAPPPIRERVGALLREAERYAREALRLDPTLAKAYQYGAVAHWLLGEHSRALALLRAATTRFPKNPEIRKQLAGYGAGRTDGPPLPLPQSGGVLTVEHLLTVTAPLVLERQLVDVRLRLPQAAEGVRIFAPRPGSLGRTGEEEEVAVQQWLGPVACLRLPVDRLLPGTGIPLRLSRASEACEFEALITGWKVATGDAATDLTAPPLVPVRLVDVTAPFGLDVGMDGATARSLLGKLPESGPRPKSSRRTKPTRTGERGARRELADPDHLQWREDERTGIGLALRELPAMLAPHQRNRAGKKPEVKDGQQVVEVIRLTQPGAETVGGVRVGDDWERVEQLLGPPEVREPDSRSYLQGGVRYVTRDGRVSAIELHRSSQLLRSGTTAFTRRQPATVFVESFTTSPGMAVNSKQAFERHLLCTGVVRMASRKAEAEYVLTARLENYREEKGQLLGAVPLKYQCSGELVFSLFDARSQEWIARDERLAASKGANWLADFGKVLGLAGVLGKLLGKTDLGKALAGGVGAAGVASLRKSMQRVQDRTPRLVEQTLYLQLTDRLYEVLDFSGRVSGIDRARGEVTVNLGSAEGVKAAGAAGDGSCFDLLIAGRALPSREEGLKADFWTLEAVTVTEHTSRCILKRVRRRLESKGTIEKCTSEPDPDLLKLLPSPAMGVSAVRMHHRLLPLAEVPL